MNLPDMLVKSITTFNTRPVPGCNPINSRNLQHYLTLRAFPWASDRYEHSVLRYGRAAAMGTPGFCPNIRGRLGGHSIIGPD